MVSVPEATPQRDALLRYSNGAVLLHWLTAALIVAQVYVGLTFANMPRGPEQGEWFTWHKTLGATILLLGLIRLAWRLAHKPPPFPDTMPRWERVAATWNHRAFYALIILLPLTGLTAVSGHGGATTPLIGGIPLPLIPGVSPDLGETAGDLHVLLVWLTIALLLLHVAAALKHQFVDHHQASGRMPPFQPQGGRPVVEDRG